MNSKDPYTSQQRIHYHDYEPKKVNEKAVKDDRLGSMKNRYFSLENQVAEANNDKVEEEEIATTNKTSDTQAFLERKDYLLKKLLAAHTLPGLEDSSNVAEPQPAPKPAPKPMRVSAFQDEFIPLFNVNSENNDAKSETSQTSSSSSEDESDIQVVGENADKVYNPKVNNLQKYQGPYSIDCMLRSRRVLIEEFLPMSTSTNRSNFFDRRFEILKMKLDIKSKFDTDKRLWNKIRRESAQIRQQLIDKATTRDRRFHFYQSRLRNGNGRSKTSLYDDYISESKLRQAVNRKAFDSSESDEDVLFFDEETNSYKSTNSKWKSRTSENFVKLAEKKRTAKKSTSQKISSVNLDESGTSSNGDSSNEEAVIRMINQQEYCMNTGTEGTSNESDEDSKCKQFGKYVNGRKRSQASSGQASTSKKIKKTNSVKKLNKSEANLKRGKASRGFSLPGDGSGDEGIDEFDQRVRIDRVGLVANTQYEELKERYKTIRNKRNKVLRKKKGVEIDMERKMMSDELKTIRAQLKKIRRKNKFLMNEDQLASYIPLDLVKNKDSKLPRQKRQQSRYFEQIKPPESKSINSANFIKLSDTKRDKKFKSKSNKKDTNNKTNDNNGNNRISNKSKKKDKQKKKFKGSVKTNKGSFKNKTKTRLW